MPSRPSSDRPPATGDHPSLAGFKRAARELWSAGDFPSVAERGIWDVGPRIVRHAGVKRGEDVLDVACGTGNAAIRAAKAGGNVIGLDLTPELFERARELADEEGVWVEWLEGDAEHLPFEEANFDVVMSTFGCMFAPRHAVTAGELARVLRTGGRMAVTAWTPEGEVGTFFKILAPYVPQPPDFAQPPVLWGSEEHVREIFDGKNMELDFKREIIQQPPFESGDAAIDFWTTKFGMMINARRHAESQGTWPLLRAELIEYYERNEPLEYLVVLGRKS